VVEVFDLLTHVQAGLEFRFELLDRQAEELLLRL
jgi:hypothetical protein